jgi:hypothetical protein
VQKHITFAPDGGERTVASALVKPGQAWVGRGRLGAPTAKRGQRTVTLIAIWSRDQDQPWVVVTDLPPQHVGVSWYALRMWIELGFAALKGVGWQWQRTRRTDPARVARYWLIVAVATVWVLAYGTRTEQAECLGQSPAYLRHPPKPIPVPDSSTTAQPPQRLISVFHRGLQALQHTLGRGRLWQRLWLMPEPWPEPPPGVVITIQDTS